MKVFLHVGMGKTGTTSIQAALRGGTEELALQHVKVVEELVPDVEDKRTYLNILQSADSEEQEEYAKSFASEVKKLSEAKGVETVIVSNEGLFGTVARIEPFLKALKSNLDVQVIAFIRHPSDWLPSAYAQWGISHKRNPGKVPTFEVETRRLIHLYKSIDDWYEIFEDQVTLLPYEPGSDTVAVFAETAGIELPKAEKRLLTRSEDAELLMRAFFNDQDKGAALPARFNRIVMNTKRKPIPSRQYYFENHFDKSSLEALIKERGSVFDTFKDKYDFDVLSLKTKDSSKPIDEGQIDSRLLDYLVHLALTHARRLHRLESSQNKDRKKFEQYAKTTITDELIAEINSLREEVSSLRAQIIKAEGQEPTIAAPEKVKTSGAED